MSDHNPDMATGGDFVLALRTDLAKLIEFADEMRWLVCSERCVSRGECAEDEAYLDGLRDRWGVPRPQENESPKEDRR